MDAPDELATAALIVSTIAGVGASAYSSKRQRDVASDTRDRQKKDQEKLQAEGRERDTQERLTRSLAEDRRKARAKALLSSGRAGTIRTTPAGVIGEGMGGYKIGSAA